MSDFEDEQYTSCENDTQREDFDYDTLMNEILDLSIESEERKMKLENLSQKAPLILTDVVSNFISSYIENEMSAVREVLEELSFFSPLNLTGRIKCAQTIKDNSIVISIIKNEIEKEVYFRDSEFNWTLVIDIMIDILTEKDVTVENKNEAQTIILNFFKSCSDESFEYKIVTYIWSRTFPISLLLDEEEMTSLKIIEDINIIKTILEIVFYKRLDPSYRNIIFIAQMLKQKNWLEFEHKKSLLELATQIENPNHKANIVDLFLEDENEEIKSRAKEILLSLDGVSIENIYTSSQNIHQVQADIEKFIEKIVEQPQVDWSVVKTNIKSMSSSQNVELSIKRFEMDKGLYSSKSLSLQTMLCKVWSSIQSHEYREELNKRLLEELEEMNDTCSSGHLLRLINIFSGFEDGIKIHIFDELTTVINHKITKIVSTQSEEVQSQIVEELGEYNQINVLSKLYGPIAILHDELWNDYKQIMDNQTFTDYFRTIVTKWTCS